MITDTITIRYLPISVKIYEDNDTHYRLETMSLGDKILFTTKNVFSKVCSSNHLINQRIFPLFKRLKTIFRETRMHVDIAHMIRYIALCGRAHVRITVRVIN